MKRFWSVCLSLALALGLCSCGGAGEPAEIGTVEALSAAAEPAAAETTEELKPMKEQRLQRAFTDGETRTLEAMALPDGVIGRYTVGDALVTAELWDQVLYLRAYAVDGEMAQLTDSLPLYERPLESFRGYNEAYTIFTKELEGRTWFYCARNLLCEPVSKELEFEIRGYVLEDGKLQEQLNLRIGGSQFDEETMAEVNQRLTDAGLEPSLHVMGSVYDFWILDRTEGKVLAKLRQVYTDGGKALERALRDPENLPAVDFWIEAAPVI